MEEKAITVKFTNLPTCSRSDYEIIFARWKQLGAEVIEMYYELDSKKILHAHGIITTKRKNFFYERLRQRGVHFRICDLSDRDNWIQYCKKNQYKQLLLNSTTGAPKVPREDP